MSSVTTSVVICTYTERRWEDLVASVASVRGQGLPCDQLVVVVDHNPELLVRARLDLDGVEVVPSTGPRGLSGARNTGIGAARGEVVVFLDDDATADPQWLERLVAPFADPRVLGVGGSAVPVWESAEPAWWPAEFGWVVGCSYTGLPGERASVRNLMGCNMSMRSTVLGAVGGFDTGLGRTAAGAAGCEETEWCIRASKVFPDGVFLYEPDAVVHHRVPEARASWSYFRTRCHAEGVSKARVARTAGPSRALSAERSYVGRTLPAGVLRNLAAGLRLDRFGPARAGAIVAGLSFTTAGFLRARFAGQGEPVAELPAVPPVLPLVIDLQDPGAALDALEPGATHRSALCLVTNGGDPVAKLRIELSGEEPLTAELLRRRMADAEPRADASQQRPERTTAAAPGGGIPATVVIATRNRPAQLVECLDSVLAGSVSAQRIVVVDNAPSDNQTAELMALRTAQDPRLVYVREDRPGLAHAHNAALPHIDTEVVAFTDDDVLADRRWLERIVRVFAEDAQAVCVTGMIAPRELETLPQQWVEGNETYDKGLGRRVFDASRGNGENPLLPYASGACGSGANMAFRTSYLQGAGGFETALGTGTVAMGGDDLAAFYDVLESGHRIVYEPAAIVLHPHHREYAALRRQVYGYGAGLGAHLTRCLLRDPRMVLVLALNAASLQARAARILRPPAVEGLPPWPRDLVREHRRGLLSGPGRYVLSRYRLNRAARQGGKR